MPAPTRPYWTVVVTSNMEDGTLIVSAHGHFRNVELASATRYKIEAGLNRLAPGEAQVDIVRIGAPTVKSAKVVHVDGGPA
jgi:hypothetical protein